MTRKKAIKRLKEIDIRGALQEDYDALHMAIEALEQNEALCDRLNAVEEENERKKIMNLADMIHGEINRICVTNDLAEYGNMCIYVKKNLDELMDIVYKARGWENDKCGSDEISR